MVLVQAVKLICTFKQQTIRVAFGLVAVLALVVGVWFGVFGEFRLSEKVRIQGAPVPLVVFIREGQDWTDFVKPLPLGYVCMLANAIFPVGLIALCTLILKPIAKRNLKRQP